MTGHHHVLIHGLTWIPDSTLQFRALAKVAVVCTLLALAINSVSWRVSLGRRVAGHAKLALQN